MYSPDRLKVLTPCVWFRGTVVNSVSRSDGDQHLLLTPDSGYSKYLNVANVNEGGLVVEIMPGQNLSLPAVNEHVAVFVGEFAEDAFHEWPDSGFGHEDGGGQGAGVPVQRAGIP